MGIYIPSGTFKKGPLKGLDRVYTNNPKFIGPGGGKLKAIGKYLIRYRKPITGIGAIAVGLGFGGLTNETGNKFSQTYATKNPYNRRRTKRKHVSTSNRCNSRANHCNTCCCR